MYIRTLNMNIRTLKMNLKINFRPLKIFKLKILAMNVLVMNVVVLNSLSMQSGLADPMGDIPFRMPGSLKAQPQKVPTKETSLEDFFPKTDLPYMVATPIDLSGFKVGGLSPKEVPVLGQNLFVVVDNTQFSTMADVYKDNRLKGKSNFVTVDSVIHPYFAIHNSIMADVIKENLCPGLASMFSAMLKVCADDYKSTEDAEVKQDIQKNMAFIMVGLKLLDPSITLPKVGTANRLAEADLKNISSGRVTKSAIFEAKEDFAAYRPFGWYGGDPDLQHFYRCRQWLSRMTFPLAEGDMSSGAEPETSSKFLESVLLFRSLDKATIGGEPALKTWEKFCRVWNLMGARDNKKEHPLLPNEYKKVFTSTGQPLDKMLQGLSEPFFRTKLLLTIRRNKPLELNPTSILRMGDKNQQASEATVFRFMPLVDEAELPWLCSLAHEFNDERASSEQTPFALLELYGRGSVLATNMLAENCWRLNAKLFETLPALVEATSRKRALSNSVDPEGSTDGRWNILSHYFKSQIESAQTPLKTDLWMRRRLESAFAAWVDSNLASMSNRALPAVIPADVTPTTAKGKGGTVTGTAAGPATRSPSTPPATSAGTATTSLSTAPATPTKASTTSPSTAPATPARTSTTSTSTASAAPADTTATSPSTAPANTSTDTQPPDRNNMFRPAVAQYLEPAPTMYKAIRTGIQQTVDELNALGYFPAKYKQPCQDLTDLCQRFESIALREVSNLYVSPVDARYLANIDQTMEKISPPVAGTVHLDSDEVVDKTGRYVGGTNLCLGRAGEVFIVLRTIRGATLCRGPMYTYYEVPGGPLKPEHWARRLDLGLVRSPQWTANFDVVQPVEQTSAISK
jgi:hypothetical protein